MNHAATQPGTLHQQLRAISMCPAMPSHHAMRYAMWQPARQVVGRAT
jgi:hypothetical protein